MDFFAGANTKDGFVSIFDKAFKDVERLYIIKGSCGCGKSTFMRRVADTAEEKGFSANRIYCSGDPDSLDGVTVPELGFGVCDGTAPHTVDVRYPAVRESLVDLGEFWHGERLLPHRERIIALTDEKAKKYSSAYSSLSAAGKLREVCDGLELPFVDAPGVKRLAKKAFSRGYGNGDGGRETVFASAFTPKGFTVLDTFGKAETVIKVSGPRSACDIFIDHLCEIALGNGVPHTVSLCATDPQKADSVFFHKSGTLVTALTKAPCASYGRQKRTDLSRFADKEGLSEVKGRIALLKKLIAGCEKQALTDLRAASEIHKELEAIYIPAMDFGSLNGYALSFIKKLFC